MITKPTICDTYIERLLCDKCEREMEHYDTLLNESRQVIGYKYCCCNEVVETRVKYPIITYKERV